MSYALAEYAGAPYAAPRGAGAPAFPSSATLPLREFAIEFDAGIWTDLYPYVVDITTRRGRNAELGAFETGQGFVTLRNETRMFDPDYTAGPYYGKLRPNRRVRFRATYAGGTFPVFVGYIDRITQVPGGPNDAATVIAFSDLFKILNRQELPVSVFAGEMAADLPVAWYRLGEPSGSSAALDTVTRRSAGVVGAPVLGAAGLVTRDADAAVDLNGTSGFATVDNAVPITGRPITLSAIVKTTSNVASVIAMLVDSSGKYVMALLYNGNYAWVWVIEQLGGPDDDLIGTIVIDDGNPHVVTATWAADGTITLYTDGVQNGPVIVNTAPINPIANLIIGYGRSGDVGLTGTVDEVAVFDKVVTPARMLAWANARSIPWKADLPGPRIARILDLAGVAAADRDLDAGTTSLQSASLDGTPLALIQKVGLTEVGSVFVTRDGKVRHIARRAGLGENPDYLISRASLSDTPVAAGAVPYRNVGFEQDDADIATRATVSRDGGTAVTYEDSAARAEFGIITLTQEGLLHDSDAYSASLAQWLVNTRKAPESEIGGVLVTPQINPAVAFPAMLGLEIGDRVSLIRQPKVGTPISADYRVEAIAHATVGLTWAITLQMTPFNQAGGLPVFIWGVTKWGQHVWGT